MPPVRNDLTAALLLRDQKHERRILAMVALRQHEQVAEAAGVGRRESAPLLDAEKCAAYAQRELELAEENVAQVIRELLSDTIVAALQEGAARSAAREKAVGV